VLQRAHGHLAEPRHRMQKFHMNTRRFQARFYIERVVGARLVHDGLDEGDYWLRFDVRVEVVLKVELARVDVLDANVVDAGVRLERDGEQVVGVAAVAQQERAVRFVFEQLLGRVVSYRSPVEADVFE